MSQHLHGVKANLQGAPIRYEMYEGRSHMVVPVIMMVEGVHCGSAGPIFYSSEELARYPEAWNGRPVPVHHPEEYGGPVSCNQPRIMESYVVGQLFNTRFEGGKLKSEAWIDVAKCDLISPSTLQSLRDGIPMDVSTGLWSDDEAVEGVYNGEPYAYVAHNIRPDHLALLPGQRGACSWQDGCGVRANKENGMDGVSKEKSKGLLKSLMDALSFAKEKEKPENYITNNQLSYQDISHYLQEKLDSMDSSDTLHYLKAVYDDFFVYQVVTGPERKVYKQDYTVNEETQKIEMTGESVEVKIETTYQPIAANQVERSNTAPQADEAMGTENPATVHNVSKEETMKVNEAILTKVDELIGNEATTFTDEDRDWLSALKECQLAKLAPVANTEAATENTEAVSEVETTAAEATTEATTETTNNSITMTVDQMEKMVANAVEKRLAAEKKGAMVDGIVSNGCDIGRDELMAMSEEALSKLEKVFAPNYSGRSGAFTGNAESTTTNAMPSVVMAEEKAK